MTVWTDQMVGDLPLHQPYTYIVADNYTKACRVADIRRIERPRWEFVHTRGLGDPLIGARDVLVLLANEKNLSPEVKDQLRTTIDRGDGTIKVERVGTVGL